GQLQYKDLDRPELRDLFIYRIERNDLNISLGRLAGRMGRLAEASELIGLAVADRERIVAGIDRASDDVVNTSYRIWLFIDACDGWTEVRGPIEPMLQARARFERLDREGRLPPVTRGVRVHLDIRIAKAQRLAGRLDETRESIRRVES